ncbi:hypothetical protein OSTOST_09287 [Ostertagia ostertagi]
MRVQYVSYTTTNHMGMVSGLHAENHGIISNIFTEHDERTNTFTMYDYWNFSAMPGTFETSRQESWYFGEPIWITNEKSNDLATEMGGKTSFDFPCDANRS